MQYDVRRLWIHQSATQKQAWESFLRKQGIKPEASVESCYGLYDADTLVGSGSLFKNIIKCVAIEKSYQGGEAVSALLSHLVSEVFLNDYASCFVYTTPSAATSFSYLGFHEIARVPDRLVLLQQPERAFVEFQERLASQNVPAKKVASIVMNANPFTKGHRYLVERAATENDVVHIFVLSEELSLFPFKVRFQLVKEGTSDLANTYVHETGEYMVSAGTFPSYFLKDDIDVTEVHAQLDAILFRDKIAPLLGIHSRYVGEEPFSLATNLYNRAMRAVFDGAIELVEIPRKEQGQNPISASRVRRALATGMMDELKDLLPETTYDFLQTEEGQGLIARASQNIEIKP